MGWRSKDKKAPVFRAPPGYRDSGRPILTSGEVVSSTYQIRELLHSDETGQVFEAWDMLLERNVALKVAWRDKDVPPLLQEARIPSAIGKSCAATVFGLGRHHGCEYLAAERIDGVTLAEYISSMYEAGQLLSVLDTMELLITMARGLSSVHAAGHAIVRMSTANILITPANRLVFAAFALNQGQLEAKPAILAPEVITGGRAPNIGTDAAVAVDLYAAGCVAVELLTARPPFSGNTLKALKFAHVHQRPPQLTDLRDDIPTELDDLIAELLAKDPANRPPSAGDFALELRAIAERKAASRCALRVLIFDADPQRVRMLWSVLRRAHSCAVVDAVADADEVANKLQNEPPDVLILNLDVPGTMNGLEMCMYFRGLDGGQDRVIVVLGTHIAEGDVEVLRQIGIEYVFQYSNHAHHKLTKLIRTLAKTPITRA
ncbi:MAG: serine/threonine protein kinase [Proteobacteria bacterium]|nr:serine/threonine protein kinase [Pseudomonadota bacterium]